RNLRAVPGGQRGLLRALRHPGRARRWNRLRAPPGPGADGLRQTSRPQLGGGGGLPAHLPHGLPDADHARPAAARRDAAGVGGRSVTCGSTSGPKVTLLWPRVFFKHADILGSTMGNSGEFEEVLELVGAGLKPVVDSVYPLAEVEQALAHLDAAEQFGKVVLRVAE